MGLREKALEFYRERSKESSLALSPVENIKPSSDSSSSHFDEEWETDALAEVKRSGKVTRNELLQKQPRHPVLDTGKFLFQNDSEATTQPAGSGAAMHNRVESLLNLIELCKELGFVEDEDELWSTVIYGLLGQIGSREAAIFLKIHDRFELKADRGFIIDPQFKLPRRSGIERVLSKEAALYYVKDILDKIVAEEKTWLQSLNAEIVIPIMKYEEVAGFILLGKPIGADDFHLDDLLYLKLFGEVLGSFYDSINRIIFISEQRKLWQEREERHHVYLGYLEKLNRASDIEESTSLVKRVVHDDFSIRLYLFLARDGQSFRPYLSAGLKKQTIDSFTVPVSEDWLWESRHHSTWYNFVDFKDHERLTNRFSPEDLTIVQSMYLLPLFFQKELEGLFIVFEVNRTLGQDDLSYLQSILQTHFFYKLTSDLETRFKDQLEEQRVDPLMALKKLQKSFEESLEKKKIPYSLVTFQISNASRLGNLLGAEKLFSIKSEVKGILTTETTGDDFVAEIFPSHFLLILKGQTKSDTWSLSKLVQKKVAKLYPEEETRPLLRVKSVSRPDQNLVDLSDFIFE